MSANKPNNESPNSTTGSKGTTGAAGGSSATGSSAGTGHTGGTGATGSGSQPGGTSGSGSTSGSASGASSTSGSSTGTGGGSLTRGSSTTSTGGGAGAATGLASQAQEYGQKIADAASSAKDYVAEKAGVVGEKFQDLRNKDYGQMADDAKQYARQNPGQALLISAAAGFLLGLLLRGSRR